MPPGANEILGFGRLSDRGIVPGARRQKGFVLIVTCIAVVILLAIAALGIDIGRMYVIKSELQAFADAAALSAAIELDGTSDGLARARTAAAQLANGPNAMKCDMGTQTINEIATSFAKGEAAPDAKTWQAQPSDSGGYRFVRVIATAPAPLIFLRAFQAIKSDFSTVAASGVAGNNTEIVRLIQ